MLFISCDNFLSGSYLKDIINSAIETSNNKRKVVTKIYSYNDIYYDKNKDILDLLSNVDVLVDSPFILEQKSYNVPFRGSKNQRIVDSCM